MPYDPRNASGLRRRIAVGPTGRNAVGRHALTVLSSLHESGKTEQRQNLQNLVNLMHGIPV